MRQIPNHPDKVWSEVEGDIENVDGVMRITRIRVKYHVKIPSGKRPEADRALATHPTKCPAYMSVKDSIDVQLSHEVEEE